MILRYRPVRFLKAACEPCPGYGSCRSCEKTAKQPRAYGFHRAMRAVISRISAKFPDWKKGDPLPENLEIMSSCEWAWSKYYVDFIKEDGEWKFWRLRLWPIYKNDFYVPWTQHPDMDEVDFPFHNHKALPESNWAWNKEIVYPADQPEPPVPYEHYEDAVPKLWKAFV